jgi:hypothetical protein
VLMMNLRLFGGAITVSLAISHGNPAEDCRFDLLLLLPWLALLFSYMFVDVQETCRRRLRRQWPSAHYIQHVHIHTTSSTHSCGWIALFPLISRSLFCFFSFCAALLFIDRGTNTRENREKRPWFSPFFFVSFLYRPVVLLADKRNTGRKENFQLALNVHRSDPLGETQHTWNNTAERWHWQ